MGINHTFMVGNLYFVIKTVFAIAIVHQCVNTVNKYKEYVSKDGKNNLKK